MRVVGEVHRVRAADVNAETIINGKRMVLKGTPQYVDVAVPDELSPTFWETEPGPLPLPVIRRQRHRLVRLTAEYELESERRW